MRKLKNNLPTILAWVLVLLVVLFIIDRCCAIKTIAKFLEFRWL